MSDKTYTEEEVKEIANKAFMHGWHERTGVEKLKQITRKAGNSVFERWWNAQDFN